MKVFNLMTALLPLPLLLLPVGASGKSLLSASSTQMRARSEQRWYTSFAKGCSKPKIRCSPMPKPIDLSKMRISHFCSWAEASSVKRISSRSFTTERNAQLIKIICQAILCKFLHHLHAVRLDTAQRESECKKDCVIYLMNLCGIGDSSCLGYTL